MSSSGATGGDQCNRRRLREQPHLKDMPKEARQKSKRNRARTTRVEETQVNHSGSQYSSPHSNTKDFRQAQTGRGGNPACGPGINPAFIGGAYRTENVPGG